MFAKINRYFIKFVVLESKLGHDPVVTSSQENVMKCRAPEYSCKPLFFYVRNSSVSSDIRNSYDFLISENKFLISENQHKFLISKNDFLISENNFLISENRQYSPIWRSIRVCWSTR